MSTPCSSSSSAARQPCMFDAFVYQTAIAPQRADQNGQSFPRTLELFIPHLQLRYTTEPLWNTAPETQPRNLYAVAYNPPLTTWTTRPLQDRIYAMSFMRSIKISEVQAEAIRNLAAVQQTLGQSNTVINDYNNCRRTTYKIVNDQILNKLPSLNSLQAEQLLDPRRQLQPLSLANVEEACIWYARFRSPEGTILYLASSSEARREFESVRAEINLNLTPQLQALLDGQLTYLFQHSSTDVQARYLMAYQAHEQNPDNETLILEKRNAFIYMYRKASLEARDRMDYGYSYCFQNQSPLIKQKMIAAMLKLYHDAPKISQKVFDKAWEIE